MSQTDHTRASHNPYHDESIFSALPSVDFRELLAVYLRKWWVILLTVVFASLAASYYLYQQPKLFESRAVLFVGQKKRESLIFNQLQRTLSGISPSSKRWSRASPRVR